MQTGLLELLPNPPLTRDQVRLLKTDKVLSGMQPTLGDLGVQSRRLDDFLAPLKDKYSKVAHRSVLHQISSARTSTKLLESICPAFNF